MRPRGGFGIIKGLSRALCLFILLVAAAPLQAAGDQATIASNFLKFLGSDKKISSEEIVERGLLAPALAPVPVAHLFKLEGGGYILVSNDRSISPVKAYSLAGEFAALPEPYRKAILDELELRVRVASLSPSGSVPQAVGSTETEARWDFLLRFDALRQPLAVYTPGSYLISTHWAQDYPYNKFLPDFDDKNVLVGCVNVAVGQIMHYYKYPATGTGVLSYIWNGQPLKTVLYHSYNWDNMPNRLDGTIPEYQTDEVALLLRDLGVANRTNFGLADSSASFSPESMVENFGYSNSLARKDNTTDYQGFIATLEGEIDAGRPLLLGLPNHMVVIDGYSDDPSGRKAHLNMGWGGSVDDFYFLDQPVPNGNNAYFDTGAGQLSIHYNIKPCSSGNDCYVNLDAVDGADGLVITGNFDHDKDQDFYEFYLKGETLFSATRGYSNVAFYVSFINVEDGSVAFALADPFADETANKTITVGNLPAGKYQVRVSLCNDIGWCASRADNFNQYTVTLTSGTLSAEEKAVVDQGLQKPPVIGNALPDLILNTAPPEVRRILIDARDENNDAVVLSVENSNPAAVTVVMKGNILELTPTSTPKIASRIVVKASAGGQRAEKAFLVMTDNGQTASGRYFTVSGTFANQSDVQTRQVILDGACTISGYNGYSNQAFFSSVLDAAGTAITPAADVTIDQSFNRGLYQLWTSLENKTGNYYEYQSNVNDKYVFTVICPAADVNPVTIAGLLGIDLSGTIGAGDLNGDGAVNMADVVLALQLLSRMDMTGKQIYLQADADGNGKIAPAELLFIFQKTAGLR
ncbi:MAG: C10 family peptidase [Syntrophales bacterium]